MICNGLLTCPCYRVQMSYDFAGMDWSLTAALGDDAALLAELRAALVADASSATDQLIRSRCDANWEQAALRLKGLAGSFGAHRLLGAADLALDSAPGDPVAIRGVTRALDELRAGCLYSG
jgi:HPt (histidine-containing phosphotransfer) domain-containing protein